MDRRQVLFGGLIGLISMPFYRLFGRPSSVNLQMRDLGKRTLPAQASACGSFRHQYANGSALTAGWETHSGPTGDVTGVICITTVLPTGKMQEIPVGEMRYKLTADYRFYEQVHGPALLPEFKLKTRNYWIEKPESMHKFRKDLEELELLLPRDLILKSLRELLKRIPEYRQQDFIAGIRNSLK
jgi:hypothetical protein